jgi:hypothetical protein
MALSDEEVYLAIFEALTGMKAKDEPWLRELYAVGSEYIKSGQVKSDDPIIFDIILSDKNAPESYKKRFEAVSFLKDKDTGFEPTVAQYIQAEQRYKQVFAATDLQELSSNAQIAEFMKNSVSPDELAGRIDGAFKAIDNADEFTKQVLAERFPSLNRTDLAKGLLLGSSSAQTLAKKVSQGFAYTEAKRAGFAGTGIAESDIAAQGLSQQELRKGYQSIASAKSGLETAAKRFGETPADIQTELEKEVLLGQKSAKSKRLASQARAEFQKESGITTGSLSRKTSGLI